MRTIFELTFLDGQKRTAVAPNFSSAKAIAAYKRHTEEGCSSHKQLTVDDEKCQRIGEAHDCGVTVWLVIDENGQPIFCAGWPQACHEHINDAINEHNIYEAAKWTVRTAQLVPNEKVRGPL